MLPASGFPSSSPELRRSRCRQSTSTVRQFPTSREGELGAALPVLAAPNDVLVLFSRVATAPATSPQTALWHFRLACPGTRGASLESYKSRPDIPLLPLYNHG